MENIIGFAFVGMLLAQLLTITYTYVIGAKLSGIGNRVVEIEHAANINVSETEKVLARLSKLKQAIEQDSPSEAVDSDYSQQIVQPSTVLA